MRAPRTLLSLMILGLAACAPGPKQPATGPYQTDFRERFERRVVGAAWTPDGISVTCATADCPPQVGLLLVATPNRDQRGTIRNYDLSNCTASLVAADRVLTSAHCVIEGSDLYFIPPNGAPNRVSGVVYQVYAGKNARENSPDVALLGLERPLRGITPLTLARGPRPTYQALTAYVINHAQENTFRIDRLDCAIRPDASFPYAIAENPDLIFGYECEARRGNSGSPLLGATGAVEAVLQDIGVKSKFIVAANVRCQPLDDAGPAACTKTSRDDIARRQTQRALGGWNASGELNPDQETSYPYRFVRRRLKLVGADERYEVVFTPQCVRDGEAIPTEIVYPSELVTVTADANGNAVTNVIERRKTTARVLDHQGDRYRVEADWSASFGPLEQESKHPRVYLGKTFSVDLPRCAR